MVVEMMDYRCSIRFCRELKTDYDGPAQAKSGKMYWIRIVSCPRCERKIVSYCEEITDDVAQTKTA